MPTGRRIASFRHLAHSSCFSPHPPSSAVRAYPLPSRPPFRFLLSSLYEKQGRPPIRADPLPSAAFALENRPSILRATHDACTAGGHRSPALSPLPAREAYVKRLSDGHRLAPQLAARASISASRSSPTCVIPLAFFVAYSGNACRSRISWRDSRGAAYCPPSRGSVAASRRAVG